MATPPLLIFVLGALSLCGPREEVVLFGSGTAQVVDEGGVLDWVAADLIHDDSPVCIEGATDGVGADVDNLDLGALRAAAVADVLVAKGVPLAVGADVAGRAGRAAGGGAVVSTGGRALYATRSGCCRRPRPAAAAEGICS